MSEPSGFYTFLPWLRIGLGAHVANSATDSARASVDLKLHIVGNDAIRNSIDRKVDLYGPGDILGVNIDAIIRTVPPQGTTNFEPNYLATIDFYDEDFPWRYSPAAPEQDQLAPWLWLLVLDETEFDLIPPLGTGLPAVKLRNTELAKDAFPLATQTWAWAHAHINLKVAETESADPAAAIQRLETELNQNPNLGCSRLICPRRLAENTRYTAFLIPAFEKGRLAGLGADISLIDRTNSDQSAWSPQSLLPESFRAAQFPVYYQWSFATTIGEDFEKLASKIKPVVANELSKTNVGKPLTMDIRSPGWGIRHEEQQPTVQLPSVFRVATAPEDPEFPAPASKDWVWVDHLAQLVNLSLQMQDAKTSFTTANPVYADGTMIDEDPVVTPPLYGSWYLPPAYVERTRMKTDWFHHMNLHPSLRVVGGVGAEVVRDNQEDYMEQAWAQFEHIRETNHFISVAQLSMRGSMALFTKHLSAAFDSLSESAATTQQVRGLRLAAMTPASRVVESETAQTRANSLASPAAMKMFRPNGGLMSRLATPSQSSSSDAGTWLKDRHFEFFRVIVIVPNVFDVQAMTLSASFDPNTPDYLQSVTDFDEEKHTSALQTHKDYFGHPWPKHDFAMVGTNITERLSPAEAIKKKVKARLPESANPDATDDLGLLRFTPDFPEPMFDALVQQSLDFVMPGIDKFPKDRCSIFKSNRTMIEAFMVGVNHEMAREMLWREFPANLNSTFFSQFWDKSDVPASEIPTAALSTKDITPIAEWPKPSSFSDPSHRIGASVEPLFFVLRGDLLRRYPNTVVFMQPAKRPTTPTRAPDYSKPPKLPIASARLEPDIFFLGFDIDTQATNWLDPGWYIGLQERPGDIHFGLDQNTEPVIADIYPDWRNTGTDPGTCVDLMNGNLLFANLKNAADVAILFYQQPFMTLVHASQMLG